MSDVEHKLFSTTDRQAAYSVLFLDVSGIDLSTVYRFVSLGGDAEELMRFVEERLSTDSRRIRYLSVKASIIASKAAVKGCSPLQFAEFLMMRENENDFITGVLILDIMAQSKGGNENREFAQYYSDYRMTSRMKELIRKAFILYSGDCKNSILITLRMAIIAGFASFKKLFCYMDLVYLYKNLNSQEIGYGAKAILSITPVFQFRKRLDADCETRNKYLQRFDEQMRNQSDECVFTFCMCAILGCWVTIEERRQWEATKHMLVYRYGGRAADMPYESNAEWALQFRIMDKIYRATPHNS